MRKRNLTKLKMGLVEANFIEIHNDDKPVWTARGFEEHRDFPIFLSELEEDETVMLGVPRTIAEYGAENFLGAEINDVSTCQGTYGMGGPGFFGILCELGSELLWLNVAVWSADDYMLLDDRLVNCHPNHYEQYHPWVEETHDELFRVFKHGTITGINVTKKDCAINFTSSDGVKHTMLICKNSNKLSPMWDGKKRKPAFKKGVMADYLLVTYLGTVLQV